MQDLPRDFTALKRETGNSAKHCGGVPYGYGSISWAGHEQWRARCVTADEELKRRKNR
jgi:hypothetical protein